ncbi:flagellar M-ring protein FliF C-terminal domain-containing protein [Candidatus Kuenenia stuttgartensis]|uniref:flagellar M-ring protein FliF C-terminal domain-containing protein n=1 Tax=Kuenenia stuttgartiensis TaxID=174633 RepID=UPI0021BC6F79|nr:flagellar M-ring protein FliF C-terminal domain-containing protein [Candidatus Kuenenia stuttgartiensis]
MLDRIVGAGKSVVRVSADLDFRHVDEKQIEFDPERRVPKVQTVTTKVSGGTPFSGVFPECRQILTYRNQVCFNPPVLPKRKKLRKRNMN